MKYSGWKIILLLLWCNWLCHRINLPNWERPSVFWQKVTFYGKLRSKLFHKKFKLKKCKNCIRSFLLYIIHFLNIYVKNLIKCEIFLCKKCSPNLSCSRSSCHSTSYTFCLISCSWIDKVNVSYSVIPATKK